MHFWMYGWDWGWLIVLFIWVLVVAVSYAAVDLLDWHHRHHPR
jgi:hypothetical protein